ncbi:hypothetical protein EM868_06790 [Cupriavidus gilardii]|uniref:hypothetical protein n=1 Tax=Cupriavidus gilardii TaxID=82541 RepID=UPI001EE62E63|nr:hypothetical protein [Cupriavidus gilardii]MCG5260096.1 hypothetical protein [Cupriavidus gilardii]MDF9429500.1 hypothetical protein [Cupriavidus gilardii]
MEETSALGEIRSALREAKAKGVESLSVDRLDVYIAELVDEVSRSSQERAATAKYQHEMEVWKLAHAHDSAFQQEMMKAGIEAGLSAIKFAVMINGGASVALLAFLGNLLTKDFGTSHKALASDLAGSLFAFLVGVAMAGVCGGFRYLSQESYGQTDNARRLNGTSTGRWLRFGVAFHISAVVVGLGSFVSFLKGGVMAYSAFVSYLAR